MESDQASFDFRKNPVYAPSVVYKGYRQAVKNIRKRKNKTQENCATRAGIKAKQWSKYEAGGLKLTTDVLPILLTGLECTETELWQETVRVQRLHYYQLDDEVREEAAQYGTPLGVGVVQGLWALNFDRLPAEERSWFTSNRSNLATTVSSLLNLIDNLVERYLDLTSKRFDPVNESEEHPATDE